MMHAREGAIAQSVMQGVRYVCGRYCGGVQLWKGSADMHTRVHLMFEFDKVVSEAILHRSGRLMNTYVLQMCM